MSQTPPTIRPAQAPRATRVRFPTTRAIAALMLREMATAYGRSPGGYIWAIASPIAAILILSFAFSLIQREPPLGTSFMLFYATGYLVFSFSTTIANYTAGSLRFSRQLLGYPVVTFVDPIIARVTLHVMTETLIMVIVFGLIVVVDDLRPVFSFFVAVQALALALALGMGIGLVNCYLAMMYPAWETVWQLLTRPLFLASGVLILPSALPRWAEDILWYNPLVHVTGLMRRAFYATYPADYVNQTYCYAIALSLVLLGLVLLRRNYRILIGG